MKNTILIHNKEYVPVVERVKEAHQTLQEFSIMTEIVSHTPVIVRAVVTTPKGSFSGISSVPENSFKQIEKANPYEVAETSAVGRALGFAGFGLTDSIASADEVGRAVEADNTPIRQIDEEPVQQELPPMQQITKEQKMQIITLLGRKGKTLQDITKWTKKLGKESYQDLTHDEARSLINQMTKLADTKGKVNG